MYFENYINKSRAYVLDNKYLSNMKFYLIIYEKCYFNNGQDMLNSENLWCLGSIIRKKWDIEKNVNHMIVVEWIKWRNTSRVLCDHKISNKLKEKFYKIVTKPTILLKLSI